MEQERIDNFALLIRVSGLQQELEREKFMVAELTRHLSEARRDVAIFRGYTDWDAMTAAGQGCDEGYARFSVEQRELEAAESARLRAEVKELWAFAEAVDHTGTCGKFDYSAELDPFSPAILPDEHCTCGFAALEAKHGGRG